MSKMSREKGKRGERQAAARLSLLLATDARRGVQFQGGEGSPDVVCAALADSGIHIEVKSYATCQMFAPAMVATWDAQVLADHPQANAWVVMHRWNGLRPAGSFWCRVLRPGHVPVWMTDVDLAALLVPL